MTTLLVLPFPLAAHYLRCAHLVKALRDKHRIVFAGGCAAAEFVRKLGFETIDAKQFDADRVVRAAREFDFSWLNDESVQEVFADHLRIARETKPAIIISDSAHVGRMVAEAAGIPHLAVINGYMTRYYAHTRGVPEGHPAKRYEQRCPGAVFDLVVRCAEHVSMYAVHRPFRKIRRRYGLRRVRHFLDEFIGDFTALCDERSYFPQKNAPSDFRYVGPAYHCSKPAVTEPLPAASKPVLYVTSGSSGDSNLFPLLDDESFGCYEVVVSGRAHHLFRSSHVTKHDFVDPQDILPRAAVVICHGGNGSIYQALSFGIPILARPSSFEQEWNVRRFESLGLVHRIPENATVPILRDLVERAGRAKGSSRLLQAQRLASAENGPGLVGALVSELESSRKQPCA